MMVLKVMMMMMVVVVVVVIAVMLMRVGSIPEGPSFGGEFLVSIGALLCLFHGLVKRIEEKK